MARLRVLRHHYGHAGGVVRLSHATLVARDWSHKLVVRRTMLLRHRHIIHNVGATFFDTPMYVPTVLH
jgi:hypothetical protein